MVFEVFLVAVVLKDVLWVVLPKPLGFVNVKRTGLGLHLLAFSAPWNRGRKTWGQRGHFRDDKVILQVFNSCHNFLLSEVWRI